ncbi:hypothetical protein PS409_08545 [Pediococcus pentosaceus]|uniref:hypothetical protein n=1 Tax=Pediococcus pentosaceus TaxID=1255 RepID=UPI002F264D53
MRHVSGLHKREVHLWGELAVVLCILMYVAYIPEIVANFMGHPVSPLQPFTAAICAFAWVEYGWHRAYKDWPIIISNIPGVVLGIITVVTVYIH